MEKNFEIGNFITALRKEKKLTQSKLGELVGVSNKAISKWENGQGLPEPKYMTRLCEVLEISVEELLNGKRNQVLATPVLDDLSRLEHVYKYYNNDSRVEVGLKDVNLELRLGEIVAVTGVSGAGKTTLINMIGGVDSFEDGEIYIEGEGISKYDSFDYENYRKKYISYIFQDYGILESYSIIDNLILVRLLMGDDYKSAKKKALILLEKIGLNQYKNKVASKLSGGQKQKLSVARAIIKDAPIILGDEITANLDSQSKKEILELLFENSKGKLIVLVTHHYEEIAPYVTRKLTLSDGEIIEDKIIKESSKDSYEITPLREPKNILLGCFLSLKQMKKNIGFFLITFFSILVCASMIFGVSFLISYLITDAGRGANAKNDNTIEVKKENFEYLDIDDLNVLENIEGVDSALISNLFRNGLSLASNNDSVSVNTLEFQRDDSLDFGEAIFKAKANQSECLNWRTATFRVVGYRMEFMLKLIRVEEEDIEASRLILSRDTLNFIQSAIYNSYVLSILVNDVPIDSVSLWNARMIVDMTNEYEEIYLADNILSSTLADTSGSYTAKIKDSEKIHPVVVTNHTNEIELSYWNLLDLTFTTNAIYLSCENNRMNEISGTVEDLGYITLRRRDISFPLAKENVFFINITFISGIILVGVVLYLLLRRTSMRLLNRRAGEFHLLKKLGFSNFTIYIHIILPYLLSTGLVFLIALLVHIFYPIALWYYLLLALGFIICLGYCLCKVFYEKKNEWLKEVR